MLDTKPFFHFIAFTIDKVIQINVQTMTFQDILQ